MFRMAGAPGSQRVWSWRLGHRRWSRVRSVAAQSVHRREPRVRRDPVFEIGPQLLAERGAAFLVEAAREAFDVLPGFREFALTDRFDGMFLVDRGRRPPALDFVLIAALARKPGRWPDGDLRNSRD
jgi:hypothetical protein